MTTEGLAADVLKAITARNAERRARGEPPCGPEEWRRIADAVVQAKLAAAKALATARKP